MESSVSITDVGWAAVGDTGTVLEHLGLDSLPSEGVAGKKAQKRQKRSAASVPGETFPE